MNINETQPLKGLKLLVAASGSIAAVKTPLLVSELIQAGAEVRCVVTPSGAKLVSPLSLSTLSRNKCYQDEDQWRTQESKPLHIVLSEWADMVVVAPLSATTLARWVHGLGDGLLASILLATERPVIAAAAMNTGMWKNPVVIKNWQFLGQIPNVIKLNPTSGLLACDRQGEGRMISNEIIQLAIENLLTTKNGIYSIRRDLTDLKLLVTAGATIETLDPARQLSNKSTGYMGVLLAQAARFRGATVDLIHGALSTPASLTEGINTFEVMNSFEMETILEDLRPSADLIAMTAAVSDLRKKNGACKTKINKDDLICSIAEELELVPDLLSKLSNSKKPNQVLLGFAALTGTDEDIKRIGEQKRLRKGCDLLMANPIDRPNQGFGQNLNGGFLLGGHKTPKTMKVDSKISLANKLLDELLDFKSKNF